MMDNKKVDIPIYGGYDRPETTCPECPKPEVPLISQRFKSIFRTSICNITIASNDENTILVGVIHGYIPRQSGTYPSGLKYQINNGEIEERNGNPSGGSKPERAVFGKGWTSFSIADKGEITTLKLGAFNNLFGSEDDINSGSGIDKPTVPRALIILVDKRTGLTKESVSAFEEYEDRVEIFEY